MSPGFRLLFPWLKGGLNRFFPNGRLGPRVCVIAIFGLAVSIALYIGSYKVLHYFHSQNELGIILSLKVLQMAWITFFALLIFSSMVTAVSTLYLSQDNEIILASPASLDEIFSMRYLTTAVSTSWMVLIFSIPVFGAYGQVFKAGPVFWPLLLFTIPAIAFIANGIAMSLIICIVYIFPAKRTKDIILYLSLLFGILLYLMFRLMRPEELVNPDQYGQFIEYFSAISAPAGPWVPAGWAANVLITYLLDRNVDWILCGLLLTTSFVLFYLGEWAMVKLYTSGYSKSQESFGGTRRFRHISPGGSRLAWFFRKELRNFTRDSSEWSQLFMVGALIVVYLYNFKALPLDRSPIPTAYISNLICFANIGLCGFLSASLATRFIYPSIGAEKGAFYLVASSPISLARFLWFKYLFYFFPFTLLTLILIVASNTLLKITGPLNIISIGAALVLTWTVLGMGLGFGAMFADFKSENKAAAMGPGAIIFLFSAVCYELLVLLTGLLPTYHLVRRAIRHLPTRETDIIFLGIWAGGTLLLSLLLVLIITRAGIRRLRQ